MRTSRSGITSVRWRQLADGVPALDNGLRVHLDRGNRVLSVQGAPVHGLRVASVTPRLSAEQALRALMRLGGGRPAPSPSPHAPRAPAARRGSRPATAPGWCCSTAAPRAWPGAITYRASSTAWYYAVVDASTGEVLRRTNLVDNAAPVTVFENYPGAAGGGTQQPRDLETLGFVPAGATALAGPFALTYLDIDDSDTADAGEDVAPGEYTFQSVQHGGRRGRLLRADRAVLLGPGRARLVAGQPEEAAVQAHYYVSQLPRPPARRPRRRSRRTRATSRTPIA